MSASHKKLTIIDVAKSKTPIFVKIQDRLNLGGSVLSSICCHSSPSMDCLVWLGHRQGCRRTHHLLVLCVHRLAWYWLRQSRLKWVTQKGCLLHSHSGAIEKANFAVTTLFGNSLSSWRIVAEHTDDQPTQRISNESIHSVLFHRHILFSCGESQ